MMTMSMPELSRRSILWMLLGFAIALPGLTPGLSADEPVRKILVVSDEPEEVPAIRKCVEEAGFAVDWVGQADWSKDRAPNALVDDMREYETVLNYVHKPLLPPVEIAMIDYCNAGGRMLVLHHAISSSKMQNPKWLEFLGVRLYPRDHAEHPWYVSGSVTYTMVCLAPDHYIAQHDVKYDRTVEYSSTDRPAYNGRRKAFDIPDTEIFHNQRLDDDKNRVLLFGYMRNPAEGEKTPASVPLTEDSAGWLKPTGKGLIIYLQAGHANADYLNPNFAQVIDNCLNWPDHLEKEEAR